MNTVLSANQSLRKIAGMGLIGGAAAANVGGLGYGIYSWKKDADRGHFWRGGAKFIGYNLAGQTAATGLAYTGLKVMGHF